MVLDDVKPSVEKMTVDDAAKVGGVLAGVDVSSVFS